MSAAVDISVDELYDLFGQDDAQKGDACESQQHNGASCSNEAVFVIRWRADGRPDPEDRCICARVTHQCLGHGEEYMGLEHKRLMVACMKCRKFMAPINIDRIRRTS